MTSDSVGLGHHPVVSRQQWLAARTALLAEEKEFTRLRDKLSLHRRELPWEKVETQYVFDGPAGKETLAQLFGPRRQLIAYHFMFGPESDQGCKHCSFWADHFDASGVHLHHRDVTFVVISRARLEKIEAFRKRMGWKFKWLSAAGTDFNYDYQVSFSPEALKNKSAVYNYKVVDIGMPDREGLSVFYKDDHGEVFHTYSCYARGIDMINTTYQLLDLTPRGRNEDPVAPQKWVRYHDRYED